MINKGNRSDIELSLILNITEKNTVQIHYFMNNFTVEKGRNAT